MTAIAADLLLESRDELGENPVYDAAADALWWVDIRGRRLQRYAFADAKVERWATRDLCCGVALTAGGVVVALGRSLALFTNGAFRMVAAIDEPDGHRLNEMRAGPDGALWVGSMVDFARSVGGSLYRVADEEPPRRMLENIGVPNSLGWSPDGSRLYIADTLDGRIMSYAVGPLRLDDPKVISGGGDLPGRPDGCAIDADGGLWSARLGAGQVVRLSSHGEVTHRIDLPPGAEPTACAFRGCQLLVTTARQAVAVPGTSPPTVAGGLFVAETPFEGLPEPSLHWEWAKRVPG